MGTYTQSSPLFSGIFPQLWRALAQGQPSRASVGGRLLCCAENQADRLNLNFSLFPSKMFTAGLLEGQYYHGQLKFVIKLFLSTVYNSSEARSHPTTQIL